MGANPLGIERKNDEAYSTESRHFWLDRQEGNSIKKELEFICPYKVLSNNRKMRELKILKYNSNQ